MEKPTPESKQVFNFDSPASLWNIIMLTLAKQDELTIDGQSVDLCSLRKKINSKTKDLVKQPDSSWWQSLVSFFYENTSDTITIETIIAPELEKIPSLYHPFIIYIAIIQLKKEFLRSLDRLLPSYCIALNCNEQRFYSEILELNKIRENPSAALQSITQKKIRSNLDQLKLEMRSFVLHRFDSFSGNHTFFYQKPYSYDKLKRSIIRECQRKIENFDINNLKIYLEQNELTPNQKPKDKPIFNCIYHRQLHPKKEHN